MIGNCDRCLKENIEVTGTPNFKICKDCLEELQNNGSITGGE